MPLIFVASYPSCSREFSGELFTRLAFAFLQVLTTVVRFVEGIWLDGHISFRSGPCLTDCHSFSTHGFSWLVTSVSYAKARPLHQTDCQ